LGEYPEVASSVAEYPQDQRKRTQNRDACQADDRS
jgi:hypothetical protein